MAETVDDLIARGRIEAVLPDTAAARAKLEHAQANIKYAAAALVGREIATHLARFNRMRQTRNRLEYGTIRVGAAAVRADLTHARGVVAQRRQEHGATARAREAAFVLDKLGVTGSSLVPPTFEGIARTAAGTR